ncbi:MAG: hypothetical protein IPK26_08670 [Planctomycetes bacterium]|nr:hypothetical protein [Planctomycetota bacterium]
MLGLLFVISCSAQTEQEKKVIEQLAKYGAVGDSHEVLTDVLAKLGDFSPPDRDAWQQMPAVRKIHEAFLAAERVEPKSGGRFLALLSRALAQQYDAARHDPLLRDLGPVEPVVRFSFQGADVPIDRIEPRHRQVILRLGEYVAADPVGDVTGILLRQFRLSTDEAYSILVTSRNRSDALLRGLAKAPHALHTPMLEAAVEALRKYSYAANHDDLLNTFRSNPSAVGKDGKGRFDPPTDGNPRWDVPDSGGGPGGGSGGGSSGGQGTPNRPKPSGDGPRPNVNGPRVGPDFKPVLPGGGGVKLEPPPAVLRRTAEAYVRFQAKHYGSAGARTFRSMIRTGRGFGGVVFGGDVNGQFDKTPESLVWTGSRLAPEIGLLRLFFSDGSVAVMSCVREEDVLAATALLGSGDGVMEDGHGVGLVGLTDPVPYFELGEDRITRIGRQFEVVTNPKIAAFDLAWSALMVDSLPIVKVHLRAMVEATIGGEKWPAIERWLHSAVGTWKFTDTDVNLTNDAGVLSISSTQPTIPRGVYLDAVGFDEDDAVVETFGARFRQVAPDILTASRDYARLNAFAAVLAVCRWATKSRIPTHGVKARAGTSRPCESLVLTEDEFAPAGALNREELRKQQVAVLEAKVQQLQGRIRAGAAAVEAPFRDQATRMVAGLHLGAVDEADVERMLAALEAHSDLIEQLEQEQEKLIENAAGIRPEAVQTWRNARAAADAAFEKYLEEDESAETAALDKARRLAGEEQAKREELLRQLRLDPAYPLRGVEGFVALHEYLRSAEQLLDVIQGE